MAARVIDQAGLHFSEMEVVAVSAGPGSYTGLRIGVSTAKGFSMAYGARLVGVPTLHAYAQTVARSSRLYGVAPDRIAIALTARQSEIYYAVFEITVNNEVVAAGSASVADRSDAAKELRDMRRDTRVLVAGDGARALVQEVQREHVSQWHLIPTALSVGTLAMARSRSGHFDDVETFEPQYLRDYVAESGKSIFDRLTI